ncbi:protein kinase family protein [Allostreptomyces psammosilenae]|uniref:Protein kinase domain-containing protein n=1 Tax=Allostreptomyces psammosilenae TaxID=1892865 RepID=A0A852ZSV7_9ACTN|nr:hypothetical protein [Allostreptomyces psammosilenae]
MDHGKAAVGLADADKEAAGAPDAPLNGADHDHAAAGVNGTAVAAEVSTADDDTEAAPPTDTRTGPPSAEPTGDGDDSADDEDQPASGGDASGEGASKDDPDGRPAEPAATVVMDAVGDDDAEALANSPEAASAPEPSTRSAGSDQAAGADRSAVDGKVDGKTGLDTRTTPLARTDAPTARTVPTRTAEPPAAAPTPAGATAVHSVPGLPDGPTTPAGGPPPPEVHSGERLAGRYRLEECVTRTDCFSTWKAVDEKLRRPVGIHLLNADHPRAATVLGAARKAALLPDPRFIQVLDAVRAGGTAYVVREWVPDAVDLGRTLLNGPLEPHVAYLMVRQLCEALNAAHEAGLYHLRLVPSAVQHSDGAQFRISGLAVDAALHGLTSEEAEREDTRAVGALLYAALCGRWPTEQGAHELKGVPRDGGRLVAPDHVRAGVHRELSELALLALTDTPQRGRGPVGTPKELAKLLTGIRRPRPPASEAPTAYQPRTKAAPPARPAAPRTAATHHTPAAPTVPARRTPPGGTPPAAGTPRPAAQRPTTPVAGTTRHVGTQVPPRQPRPVVAQPGGPVPPLRPGPPAPAATPARRPRRGRRLMVRAVQLILSMVLLVALGVGSWTVANRLLEAVNGNPDPNSSSSPTPGQTSPEASETPVLTGEPIAVDSAQDFDPSVDNGLVGGNGEENGDEVANVIDGDSSTEWQTMRYYRSPNFGNEKDGVGIILDLGEERPVGEVTVDFSAGDTRAELRAAPTGTTRMPTGSPDDYEVVASGSGAGEVIFSPDSPVETRYLLVWITELPPETGSTWRARISEIEVTG